MITLAPRKRRDGVEPPAPTRPAPAVGLPEPHRHRYRAIDAGGTIVEGTMNAADAREVLRRLRGLGLRPVDVAADAPSVLGREFSLPGFGGGVKVAELAMFARQFATMNRAGVPLLRALDVLRRQCDNDALATTLDAVRGDVEGGRPLSDAMQAHPRVFDRLTVSLIRAGEAAGALDVVLGQIADTLERRATLRQKLRSAFAYPIVVLCMVAAVTVGMLTIVIPTFAGIYDDLGGTLPLPTRILIGVSDAFTRFLPLIALATIVALIGLRAWRRTPAGRLRWDGWMLQLPLAGPILTKAGMARIGSTISVLVRSGLPVLDSLRITADTVGNARLARVVDTTREGVARGESLAANLAADPLVPPLVTQLVAVGEETGTLDDVTATIAASFEAEVETAVDGFASIIEPVLMALIGLVVGGIVVALYLPMFRVIDLVQ